MPWFGPCAREWRERVLYLPAIRPFEPRSFSWRPKIVRWRPMAKDTADLAASFDRVSPTDLPSVWHALVWALRTWMERTGTIFTCNPSNLSHVAFHGDQKIVQWRTMAKDTSVLPASFDRTSPIDLPSVWHALVWALGPWMERTGTIFTCNPSNLSHVAFHWTKNRTVASDGQRHLRSSCFFR